jgi:hypothetical protein
MGEQSKDESTAERESTAVTKKKGTETADNTDEFEVYYLIKTKAPNIIHGFM